jgi:hypothetical protein
LTERPSQRAELWQSAVAVAGAYCRDNDKLVEEAKYGGVSMMAKDTGLADVGFDPESQM